MDLQLDSAVPGAARKVFRQTMILELRDQDLNLSHSKNAYSFAAHASCHVLWRLFLFKQRIELGTNPSQTGFMLNRDLYSSLHVHVYA